MKTLAYALTAGFLWAAAPAGMQAQAAANDVDIHLVNDKATAREREQFGINSFAVTCKDKLDQSPAPIEFTSTSNIAVALDTITPKEASRKYQDYSDSFSQYSQESNKAMINNPAVRFYFIDSSKKIVSLTEPQIFLDTFKNIANRGSFSKGVQANDDGAMEKIKAAARSFCLGGQS